MSKSKKLLKRAETLLERFERLLTPEKRTPDWRHIAWRWRPEQGLVGVANPHRVALDDLLCMERQKAELVRNTEQFLAGRSANNALLWGSRGTGKSSLIKALLSTFSPRGLRLIEVEKQDLVELTAIVEQLQGREERFLIYCDDLSFEAGDPSYKALKAVLDGSIEAPPENLLIYATSNRRHLLPETMRENQDARVIDGELHLSDAAEEKISLSERFGLWLSFHPYNQEQYLAIVDHWLKRLGSEMTCADEATQLEALRWASQRGSRSGRVAQQFARDWAGRQQG